MQIQFKNHLQENFSFLKGKKILVAVSAGVDSVVLAHLCKWENLDISLAHCNFGLRGKESDADEKFVKNLAVELNARVFTKYFDTPSFAKKNKLSIQMAARELRYQWFSELAEKQAFDYILTAHHANDSLETFLINTIRGTGLEGLTGIPEKNGKIIRPMLVFSRKEIEGFAKSNKISWREDSSNASEKYLRNKIRHKIIPVLENENPGMLQNFLKTQEHLRQSSDLIEEYTKQLSREIIKEKKESLVLDIQKIKAHENPKAVLFQLLKAYGFTEWENLCDLLFAQSGKQVFSPRHRLIKDRNHLILTKINEANCAEVFEILEPTTEVSFPMGKLSFETIGDFQNPDRNTIYVDKKRLEFPLKLRKREQGDFFFPFGMDHRKKISSYLKDEKFSLPEKEKVWLLRSGENTVWIIGHRADNRFRLGLETDEILKITYWPNS